MNNGETNVNCRRKRNQNIINAMGKIEGRKFKAHYTARNVYLNFITYTVYMNWVRKKSCDTLRTMMSFGGGIKLTCRRRKTQKIYCSYCFVQSLLTKSCNFQSSEITEKKSNYYRFTAKSSGMRLKTKKGRRFKLFKAHQSNATCLEWICETKIQEKLSVYFSILKFKHRLPI